MYLLKVLLKGALPLLYCLATGGAFSLATRKSFLRSLAPAFLIQIILMLVCGMTFGSVSMGIYAEMIVALAVYAFFFVKKRVSFNIRDLGIFLFVYLFVWITNYSKCFFFWDEFSHWGIAVKETLRLDALFCTSDLNWGFNHYVPSLTLFEALWCRLMGGYSEPNVYRGAQMLIMSMILPVLDGDKNKRSPISDIIILSAFIGASVLFSLQGFHTACSDIVMGVMLYYSIWSVISNEDERFSFFCVIISLSCLALVKMTAIVFVPMVTVFYAFYRHKNLKRDILSASILTAVPVVLWKIFDIYMHQYVSKKSGGYQSYGHIGKDVIIDFVTHNGGIPWQNEAELNYWKAIFTKSVAGWLPYLPLIIIICAAMELLVRRNIDNASTKKKAGLISLWIPVAGIVYAEAMNFSYLTTFGEYGATTLSSFPRYMSTFLICALFLGISFFMFFSNSRRIKTGVIMTLLIYEICAGLFTDTQAHIRGNIDQFFPGGISMGEWIKEDSELPVKWLTDYVQTVVPEDSSVYVISRGNEDYMYMRYYLVPVQVDGSSPGPPAFEGDSSSEEMSSEKLVKKIQGHEYLYMHRIDDPFLNEYSDIFVNPGVLRSNAIYKIDWVNDRIELSEVAWRPVE